MVGLGVEDTDINDDDNDPPLGMITDEPAPRSVYVVATTLLDGKVVGCKEVVFLTWISYFCNLPFRVSGGGGCQATKISCELMACAAVLRGAPDGADTKQK